MKQLVVLSDIHAGNKLSVMPTEFTEIDGTIHRPNIKQRALYRAWESVVADWGRPDYLVVNGEPIDGQGAKSKGVELWTTDYLEQVRCAVEMVKEFKAKELFVTRGSNYHVEMNGVSVEEVFGSKVGATEVDGRMVNPELFLDIEGVSFNLAHHISGSMSGWMYRSTPPAKEAMLSKLNESHRRPARVIVRSHNHYYWFVGSTSHLSLLTPAWKLQDWFAYKATAAGSVPDIGAVRFTVSNGEFRWEAKLFRDDSWRPPIVRR